MPPSIPVVGDCRVSRPTHADRRGPVASLAVTSHQSRGNHRTHDLCRPSTGERHTILPSLRLSDKEERLVLYLRELWFDYRCS